jgi:hypothetical protein
MRYAATPAGSAGTIRTQLGDVMTASRVALITAELGKPSTLVLESSAQTFFTSSLLIQRVLLSAFLARAAVEIDLVDGSKEIKRVHPFDPGGEQVPHPPQPDRVSRIATQRKADGKDHLEVFLIRSQGSEQAFNVFDPLLQQLLTTAFDGTRPGQGPSLQVTLDGSGKEIEAARLGQVP